MLQDDFITEDKIWHYDRAMHLVATFLAQQDIPV